MMAHIRVRMRTLERIPEMTNEAVAVPSNVGATAAIKALGSIAAGALVVGTGALAQRHRVQRRRRTDRVCRVACAARPNGSACLWDLARLKMPRKWQR